MLEGYRVQVIEGKAFDGVFTRAKILLGIEL